jgi:pimeloyl-ACP methyl ester carboxylesterase
MKKSALYFAAGIVFLAAAMVAAFLVKIRHEEDLTDAVRQSLPGSFAKLPMGTVRYDWHGPEGGPVVVLVHGFSTPSFVFYRNVPALVDAGFRVLTYDHFGRGNSDRPPGAYDADFFDRELIELLQALHVTAPVRLVGYSLGGGIAAVFTARHPEKVARLALLAPVGYMPPPSGTEALLHIPVLGQWLFAMVGSSTLVGGFEADGKLGTFTPEQVALFTDQWKYRGTRDAIFATAVNYPMGSLSPEFQKIGKAGTPTLAMWATADATVAVDGARRMQLDVPQAQVVMVQDGTHNFPIVESARTNQALMAFFTK